MGRRLRFLAPAGYGAVVPLDRQRHAGFGLRRDATYAWARTLNAVPVGGAEFFAASRHYPLAFLRDARSGEFRAVAVLGLREHENNFVDAAGRWATGHYVPAYVRRFPFCVAPVTEGADTPRNLICVQEDQLSADTDQALFAADGTPTAAWERLQRLIEVVEASHQQTRVLGRRLEALELLVPFEALALPQGSLPLRLQGLFRVDEARLPRLPERALRTLLRKGELRAVYAHLLSLDNFLRLLERAGEHA